MATDQPAAATDYGELPDLEANPGNKTVADPSSEEEEEEEEEGGTEIEEENIMVPFDQARQPALEAVAKMIGNHSRIRKPDESENVELLEHHIGDKEGRVPKLNLAPKLTVRDMMPKGEEGETGPIDPSQIVNLAARGNCVELCLVQKIVERGITYLALPKKFVFDEVTGS